MVVLVSNIEALRVIHAIMETSDEVIEDFPTDVNEKDEKNVQVVN